MLISGVALYLLLPKLSFFKPSSAENDVTKIDAEISKVSTIQSIMPDQVCTHTFLLFLKLVSFQFYFFFNNKIESFWREF